MSSIKTRFAPSPTGFLHLGGARTALFNWLFAKQHNGDFLLRIEDTDQARNTPDALQSIHAGLTWLGLKADEEAVYQSKRVQRHQEVAHDLLRKGHAYWCTANDEEIAHLKAEARIAGKAPLYPGRDAQHAYKKGAVLRFRMPREGTLRFSDHIQGDVATHALQLDDLVLLRSDGTPTYMLAVVVDDHDMHITHVIRGVDHLSNTPKQISLYQALSWPMPVFAHMPLIHGADGAKLSKRHGALDVLEYKKQGMLPAALRNALLRLGWGYGDQEIFSTQQMCELFDVTKVTPSPARFDPQKLLHLNHHYLQQLSVKELLQTLQRFTEKQFSHGEKERLQQGLPALVQRAKTIAELADQCTLYQDDLPTYDAKAQKLLPEEVCALLAQYKADVLDKQAVWTAHDLESVTRAWSTIKAVKLKQLAQPLRAALTGRTMSPPLFDVMAILGQEVCFKRLSYACRKHQNACN